MWFCGVAAGTLTEVGHGGHGGGSDGGVHAAVVDVHGLVHVLLRLLCVIWIIVGDLWGELFLDDGMLRDVLGGQLVVGRWRRLMWEGAVGGLGLHSVAVHGWGLCGLTMDGVAVQGGSVEIWAHGFVNVGVSVRGLGIHGGEYGGGSGGGGGGGGGEGVMGWRRARVGMSCRRM